MSEPTPITLPDVPTAGSAEPAAQPTAGPKLDVRPPWTVEALVAEKLPKELVGAYLHG